MSPLTARCFVAVTLGPAAEAALRDVLVRARALRCDVRWVAPQNLHCTLLFLGDVEHARLDGVSAALSGVPAPHLQLGVDGCGRFPPRGAPRVVWVGLHGDVAALEQWVAALALALSPFGFEREGRPFHAHVTLGRAKGARGVAAAVAELQARAPHTAPEPIAGAALYQSELSPEGSRYRALVNLR